MNLTVETARVGMLPDSLSRSLEVLPHREDILEPPDLSWFLLGDGGLSSWPGLISIPNELAPLVGAARAFGSRRLSLGPSSRR